MMIPSKPAMMGFDREGYDAPVVFTTHVSSMGALGQAFVYTSFPHHSNLMLENRPNVLINLNESSNQETLVPRTVSTKSHKPFEETPQTHEFSVVENTIPNNAATRDTVCRGRNELLACYSFPPARPSHLHRVSHGGSEEYVPDRSKLPLSSIPALLTSNSWQGPSQVVIPVQDGSFKNGGVENTVCMEDISGKHNLHSVKSSSTFPLAPVLVPPGYRYMHRPCEGLYSQSFLVPASDNQSLYYGNIQNSLMNVNNISKTTASTDPKESSSHNHSITDAKSRETSNTTTAVKEKKEQSETEKDVGKNEVIHAPSSPSSSKEQLIDYGCTCKKSRCLMLYCLCFSAGNMCRSICRCTACMNNTENQQDHDEAIKGILNRNPNAFEKKDSATVKSVLSCKCRKSQCLKKYCECFNGNTKCSDTCRCLDCHNTLLDGDPKNFAETGPMLSQSGNGNEKMLHAVQNLTSLKANSPSRSAISSPSLPSVVTMTSAVSSGDDDDSTTGINRSSLRLSTSLQGMDVLALAAMSELRNLVSDTSASETINRSNIVRTSLTSSSSSVSLDDVPSYNEQKPIHQINYMKRPYDQISNFSDNVHFGSYPMDKNDASLTEVSFR